MKSPNITAVGAAATVKGVIALPGDKSISHRYAMLAAVADGTTHLENFSSGVDCASTLACMSQLGAAIERGNGGSVLITGGRLRQSSTPLDCGNSGSTMRMLTGILAGQAFTSELVGDESLSRRPMRRVIEPLERMGASITAHDGRAPLRIRGGELKGIEYRLPVASAQVKSAVLFAGLFAEGATWTEEPVPTRDHTEHALQAFGARVERHRNRTGIAGGQPLRAIDAVIPGDLSSAAFFLCAAALFPGSNLVLENVLLNPTRAVLLDVLSAMGLRVSVLHMEDRHGELAGVVRAEGGKLGGATIAGPQTAALIDELPVLAAIAPFTAEGIEVRDAGELRHKETDRIAAVTANLRAMGARVEERQDGFVVSGGQRLHGAEVDAFGDHRIAMAFAIAALRAEGETRICGSDAARISFPEFFDILRSVSQG